MPDQAQDQLEILAAGVRTLVQTVGYIGALKLLAADARARAEAGAAPEATGDLLHLARKLDDLALDVDENSVLP